MRTTVRFLAATALVAAFAASPSARGKDAEDRPTSSDLLSRGIRAGGADAWGAWWSVNRAALIKTSWRASTTATGALKPIDGAARARARDALLAELKSKEPIVASEAAFALGRLGDVKDVATLAQIVGDGKESSAGRLHRLAAVGLGLLPLGDATAAADARKALFAGLDAARGARQPSPFFWTDCAYALALRGDAAALPHLVDLRDAARAKPETRAAIQGEVLGAITYAITVLGGSSDLTVLDEQAKSTIGPDRGVSESWSACHALTRIPGEDSRKILRRAARDDREHVRRTALTALGTLADAKDDETAALLVKALNGDDDPACRHAAAISLGRMAHPSSGPALLRIVNARSTGSKARDRQLLLDRNAAIFGLGLCARAKPDASISAVLSRELGEPGTQEGHAVLTLACGLARMETERGRIAALMARDNGGVLAPIAASALALVGAGPDELKLLHEQVAQYQFPDARGEAALTLGALRDHTVVDRLRAIVGGKKAQDVDRATAAACLGYVGDDDDIDVLLGAITASGSNERVRASLVHALGRLLDRTENAALGRLSADALWSYSRAAPDAVLDVLTMGD